MMTNYKTLMKGGKKMRQIRNASDTTCKQLLRDEECFADLCNYAFFKEDRSLNQKNLFLEKMICQP